MPLMPPIPPPPGLFPPMMPGLPPLPPPPPSVMAQLMNNNNPNVPPARLPPRPAFVPHQLRQRVPQQSVPYPSSLMRSGPMSGHMPSRIPSPPPPPPPPPQVVIPAQQQSILSAQPLLYKNQATADKPAHTTESFVSTFQNLQPASAGDSKSTMVKSDKPLVTKLEQTPHPVSKAFLEPTESAGKSTSVSPLFSSHRPFATRC